MYLMITSRCNFRCGHCCYACTSRGVDMSFAAFKEAMKLASDWGSYITLGGGEPTLHPEFLEMLGLATMMADDGGVHVITNGSQTKVALRLADLARRGVVGAELSRSQWHLEQKPIDDRVVKAFTRAHPVRQDGWSSFGSSNPDDKRGIRVTTRPIRSGRSKQGKVECPCEDLLIDPLGRIFHCGCRLVQYGDVFDPKMPDSFSGECSRTQRAETQVYEPEFEQTDTALEV